MGFRMLFGGVAVAEYRPTLFSSTSLLVTHTALWVALSPVTWSHTCVRSRVNASPAAK